ncbi:LLM class flavin-dependent oxidoreductase [Geodermatophilus sabuli]|uniref:Flavin-dependent oxidoreductase, luciferase family (Includes alkanesulfonate monooxygenase SsuD and methylene tetrahydromethanopterin reductase) n=1 Tax=Geodermatophilus sabuli TaxID=1564158 RepID=A0A285E6E5_9ACTN|nr:LLM class flavin-dependent oxidoreductase [Geodermatophilus sabuli]MBB3082441.1 alkanesulfonate monooxygenase SsuD/methylene tetrahydromethanopterin reductase-like flavin-dependent oxidoreductase (luciferase family) [Geodermatophilus sabuli]SNX94689.1 Flavin-dependent oxidoreductase, luciferase family (includes alkanesulfonate monooxygenase SsuD and methylene tetrahydromethanopterin reductase) [Geodermatophilus sabuli]
MKFHWFAEVTYDDLPDRFPAPGQGGWVDSPIDMADSGRVGENYRMFIRLMQQADRDGFDGLAVNEHHQTPFAMTPSPNLLAASLASSTQNAAILVIGDSLALYNPPTRVAEEMAYLDCLSEGRLIAGFVFGTPMDSAFAYARTPVELRDRFHEARRLVLRAWEEREPFAFNGKYTQLRYVNLWPRPIQQRPPIWIPGSSSVETWELVTRENYCYGHLSFSGLQAAKPLVDGYWDYVAAHDGDMNPHRMAFTQLVCVADTDAEAEAKYYEAVKYFQRVRNPSMRFATPPGYNSTRSLAETLKNTSDPAAAADRERAVKGEMSFWEYDEKGYIVAGTPDRVAQRLRELATELRVGQLIASLHMGNLPEETAAENTHLFGTQVIPQLRDLWADQPDHWTPQVSQQRVAAASRPAVPAGA